MRSIQVAFLGLIVVALLSSCEGNTDRTWRITNSSKSTLYFKIRSKVQNHDSLKIAPNQTKEIMKYSQLGGNENAGSTSAEFHTIEFVSPKDSSLKELSTSPKWNVVSTQVRRIPSEYEHNFKLIITEEDL